MNQACTNKGGFLLTLARGRTSNFTWVVVAAAFHIFMFFMFFMFKLVCILLPLVC
jgi:hypothetical protein